MIKEENIIVALSSTSRKDEYKNRLINLLQQINNCSYTIKEDEITITFNDLDSIFNIRLIVISINMDYAQLLGYAPESIFISDILHDLERKRDVLLYLTKPQDGG